jgi:hypothetical protein
MLNKKLLAAVCFMIFTGCHASASEKAAAAPALEITTAYVFMPTQTYNDYQGSYTVSYVLPPYYDGFTLKNPYDVNMNIENDPPANAVYSLYTYKKTFAQGGKRNYMQGIRECDPITPLATQADINNDLDKIYETSVVKKRSYQAYGDAEPTITLSFNWDGYTDPKFAGQKTVVRDCVIAAVHDGSGNLVAVKNAGYAAEGYSVVSGAAFTADKTVSAKIYVGYAKPVKKISALLMTENCGIGALPYDVVNQGAEAIVADINRRLPGDVVAHIELKNPTLDPADNNMRIFEWKDIKTEDGKYFTGGGRYGINLVLETDDMTFTGIKDGYIYGAWLQDVPSAKTGIKNVKKTDDIKITQTGKNSFTVNCDGGVCKDFTVTDFGGRVLDKAQLSGGEAQLSTSAELSPGTPYIITATGMKNGQPVKTTLKVIQKK